MSGQQIGSAVGFVAGFFLPGGPAVWSAIGGAIGGWISPTQVNGPRIGDGANQSSAEGQPIAWVIGTCGWLQGNIVDKSPRREVKKTDDGKGSGQEVNTFEAHQDFVLMVCESSEHRESLMTGPLIIKVDGKIVYDMRPDKNFGAENAKFLQNHTFYNGNEAQMPDPTCEAFPHNGVGNTPYYRGVFTIVCRDINLTQYGDRIPVYEFVMVGAGEVVTETTTAYVPPVYGRFQNSHYPLVDPDTHYTFSGSRSQNPGDTPDTFDADTLQEVIAHFNDLGFHGYPSDLRNYQGFSSANSDFGGTFTIDAAEAQLDPTGATGVILCYNEQVAADWYNADPVSACTILPYVSPGLLPWYGFRGGELARIGLGSSDTDPRYTTFNNCTALPNEPPRGFPYLQGILPLYVLVTARAAPRVPVAGDPCALGVPVLLPDSPEFVIDCAGTITPTPIYAAATGAFHVLQEEATATTDGQTLFLTRRLAPILADADPNNTEAYWTAAYDAAVAAGEMTAGQTYGVDYPVSTVNVYSATTSTTDVTQETVGLDTAITRICKRGGLTEADIDVSEMDQQLLGYMITQPYNGADCIRPLMTAFTSYGSEYDGQLHFHQHGEAIEIVVNPDDFITGSDETDKNTREQEIEYPRLFSVTAIDPTQDYVSRPQVERRISPDVNAIGEEQMQVPVVMTPDTQRQLASIGMKVSWARAQGKREFSVPYATSTGLYLYLVAGKPFALDGKRYVASNVRLEDGEIHFEAVYDRQSAYTSDVTATPALPPTAPPSSIGGVTLFAGMNLPRLRSRDSTPGMYIAVDGLLDAWPGCALQMSIDAEASWTTAIGSMTQASVMGYLTAPIDDQPSSTLSVSVHGGDLNTITDVALANRENASAVITDGVSELLQFQTADETDPDQYDLTDLVRDGLGTTAAAHNQGDRFVELSSVYFLPLDASLAGRTILFRPVTFGTPPESNAVYAVTFLPQFTGPQVVSPLTVGGENITVDGASILVVTYA